MATIGQLMQRVQRVEIPVLAADSIEATREQLIEHQQDQMYAGKNADGRDTTPFYSASTIARKKKKGQPTDRVTRKDTGAFYKGIFVDVRQTTYVIDSTDRKAPWLINRYGESIFGLGGVFKIGYLHDLQPVFQKKVRNALRL